MNFWGFAREIAAKNLETRWEGAGVSTRSDIMRGTLFQGPVVPAARTFPPPVGAGACSFIGNSCPEHRTHSGAPEAGRIFGDWCSFMHLSAAARGCGKPFRLRGYVGCSCSQRPPGARRAGQAIDTLQTSGESNPRQKRFSFDRPRPFSFPREKKMGADFRRKAAYFRGYETHLLRRKKISY